MVIAGVFKVATDDVAPPEEPAHIASNGPVKVRPGRSQERDDDDVRSAVQARATPPPIELNADAPPVAHDGWVGLPLDSTGFSMGPGIARSFQEGLLSEIHQALTECTRGLPEAPLISELNVELFIETEVAGYRVADAKSTTPTLDATAARCVEAAFRRRVNMPVHDDVGVFVGSKYRVAFPLAAANSRKPPRKLAPSPKSTGGTRD